MNDERHQASDLRFSMGRFVFFAFKESGSNPFNITHAINNMKTVMKFVQANLVCENKCEKRLDDVGIFSLMSL